VGGFGAEPCTITCVDVYTVFLIVLEIILTARLGRPHNKRPTNLCTVRSAKQSMSIFHETVSGQ
jgi:hypothetical protein